LGTKIYPSRYKKVLHYPLDAFKHPSQGTGLYLPFSRRFEPMNEELDAHINLPQRDHEQLKRAAERSVLAASIADGADGGLAVSHTMTNIQSPPPRGQGARPAKRRTLDDWKTSKAVEQVLETAGKASGAA
jgi:hypothetical protein